MPVTPSVQRSGRLSLAQYQDSRLVRSSVEREFIIIGEAASPLSRFAPGVFDSITGARRIVDFRNQLTHEYRAIDDALVWAVVERDVATLRRECALLLESLSAHEDRE